MQLPIRIQNEPGDEPVISVDGAWNAPGLNLSHWPGNRTPPELRHELSTGSALAFARLDPERRAALAAGCTAIANNHYDTDGVCAVFAVRHPELALPHARALLDAAATGDFYRLPTEEAYVLDRVLGAWVDPERSPEREALAGLDDRARHERALRGAVAALPRLLDGGLAEHEDLWRPELEALRSDRARLARARRDDLVHLDLAVWTAPLEDGAPFDACRHALFGATEADRVLLIGTGASGAGPAGTSCRLLVSTRSWFDLPGRERLPRPDLAGLAARLAELEAERAAALGLPPPGEGIGWHAQSPSGASPELWYGAADHPLFADRADVLRASRLDEDTLRRTVIDSLRDSLVLDA